MDNNSNSGVTEQTTTTMAVISTSSCTSVENQQHQDSLSSILVTFIIFKIEKLIFFNFPIKIFSG